MISKDSIRDILANSRSMALPPDVGYDVQFVLDSFSMVLLQAALEDRYGIVLDPAYEDLQLLASVNEIHDYLSQRYPDRVAS